MPKKEPAEPETYNLDRENRTYTLGWIDSMARRVTSLGQNTALVLHPDDARLLLAALQVYRDAVTDRSNTSIPLQLANWDNGRFRVTIGPE